MPPPGGSCGSGCRRLGALGGLRTGQCPIPVVSVLGGCLRPSVGSESLDGLSHEHHWGPFCPSASRPPRPPAPQPQPLGEGLQVAPGPRDAKGPPRQASLGGARTCTPYTRHCFCPSLLPVHPRGDGTAPRCPQCQSRCPCLSHHPVIGLPSSGTGVLPPHLSVYMGPTPQPTPHHPRPSPLTPHPGGLGAQRPLPSNSGSCRGPGPPAVHNALGPSP